MATGMLHGPCVGRQPERETLFFGLSGRGDEGQFVCEAVVAGVALTRDWFLQGVHCAVVRVCSYRAFWNLWLQIAVLRCFLAMCVDTCGVAK
jgi:hypothetical protein